MNRKSKNKNKWATYQCNGEVLQISAMHWTRASMQWIEAMRILENEEKILCDSL